MLRLTFGVPITKYVLIIILMVWSFFSRCCPLHFECKVREDGIHYWCQQIRHTDRDYGLCVWSVKTQVFADKWFDSAICLGQMSSSCPLMEKRFIKQNAEFTQSIKPLLYAHCRCFYLTNVFLIIVNVDHSFICFFETCSVDHSFLFDYSWSWLS